MKLKIYNGEPRFYQWDTGRILLVESDDCDHVEFGQRGLDNALLADIHELDGLRIVAVPDVLLQVARTITAYLVSSDMTYYEQNFPVIARPKPDDYVFTEDDIRRWDDVIAAVQDEYTRMTNEDLLPALQEMYKSELASAKTELEQTAAESETAAMAAQQAAKTAEDAATASAASAQESASHNAACAESAANAETSAKAAAGHAQAMAGTFDFTGYLRYQIVEQAPETYEEGVLYIVAFT